MSHDASLLLITLLAIIGLIVLVTRFKLNAFIALVIASLFVGLCSGMNLPDIPKGFLEGMGGVLGNIAGVVALGTILGKLLAESGGAEVVAKTLVGVLGTKRLHWTMLLIGFIVGIPTWFTVGLVLLIPIVFTIAKETRTPLLLLGLPLVAGLSTAHGLIPPHPGPMAAIGVLQADTGKIILYSLLIGFPAAIVAGPIWGKIITPRVPVELGGIGAQLIGKTESKSAPGFALTLLTILLPVVLMLSATVADVSLAKENRIRQALDFLGSPLVAMLAAVLFAFWSFGIARGFDMTKLQKFSEECLGPVAMVLLVVGAGGGFSKVLDYSGVGKAIAGLVKSAPVSPLILGWLTAAVIRIATGSATVAITAAAGILAPVAAATPGLNVELFVIAMGAGSLILSHVNDGGFWFVKEYLNMTVTQTLQTWTVLETIVSIVALMLTLILNALIAG